VIEQALIEERDRDGLGEEVNKMAAKGNLEAVVALVQCRANLNAHATGDRRSALHLAAADGNFEMCEFLLEHKADVHAKDRWGGGALGDAMRGGHTKITKLLQAHGALGGDDDPRSTSMSNAEKMCQAASRGDIEAIKKLVGQGCPVNEADYDKRSPLHLAAAEGHLQVVEFLILYGADVRSRDRWGGDPLKDALRGGHAKVQQVLRKAGARGGTDDHSDHMDMGDRMCHSAAKGNLEQIQKLVAKGASVDACDYDKRSALHLSAAEGHYEVVCFLLDHKADARCVDRWGGTPLKDAVRGGHRKVQERILDAMPAERDTGEDSTSSRTELEKVTQALSYDAFKARPIEERARMEQWHINRKEIVIGSVLGEGQQGYVTKGDWRGMTVAVKVIKPGNSKSDDMDFTNEVEVLSHLRHPTLVLFLGACLVGEPRMIISEYLPGGSLEDEFEQRKGHGPNAKPWRPPVKTVHMWALELAQGLSFLHNCNPPIIHRDLKPGNLLLTAEGHLKVSDFGLSKIYDMTATNGEYRMTGVTGTLRYMAPEVVRSDVYTEKVDIYSFAFNMWFMCAGDRPLLHSSQREFLDAARAHRDLRPDLECIGFRPFAALMAEAWHGNPDLRPVDPAPCPVPCCARTTADMPLCSIRTAPDRPNGS
jgi:ankyrin repeat protein